MSNAFDTAADTYDRDFSRSRLGHAQRQQVWNHLAPLLASSPMRVLELNCGTGIDALHIADHGHHVLATDASPGMLRAAQGNARGRDPSGSVEFEPLAFAELPARGWRDVFGLVLSDFGGLNCIDAGELGSLRDPLADALTANGRLIAVLMPDRSVVETAYFLAKGRASDAFRRWRGTPVQAPVNDVLVTTWYHAPGTVARAFAPRFRVRQLRPIGFFVPPGYLEPRFTDRPGLVRNLARGDERVRGHRWLARLADHYLIDLERVR